MPALDQFDFIEYDNEIDDANDLGGVESWDDQYRVLEDPEAEHDDDGVIFSADVVYLDEFGAPTEREDAERERRHLARETAAAYREARLRKLADRIAGLRFLDAPEGNVNVALEEYFKEWALVRPGDKALADERLANLGREAGQHCVRVRQERERRYREYIREHGIRTNLYYLNLPTGPDPHDIRLFEVADIQGRDLEIAMALRTPPVPPITELAERFGVSYQMIQKAERRIRAKCREAAIQLHGNAPEWTMERARRRPGVRGPSGPSSWTRIIRARRRRAA